jgi:hypothetical protein
LEDDVGLVVGRAAEDTLVAVARGADVGRYEEVGNDKPLRGSRKVGICHVAVSLEVVRSCPIGLSCVGCPAVAQDALRCHEDRRPSFDVAQQESKGLGVDSVAEVTGSDDVGRAGHRQPSPTTPHGAGKVHRDPSLLRDLGPTITRLLT